MVINTNIAAESSAALLGKSSSNLSKSLQRLSSGSKIISPSDDAAGLAMSMHFDEQSTDNTAASNNVSNALSFSQTQDGYMQQVSSALDRMSELAVDAQDPTKTNTDRSDYDAEYQQLSSYITSVAGKDFNGVSLFTSNTLSITTDANADLWGMKGINLGATAYNGATGANVATSAAATTALTKVQSAITQLATDRATIGANEARLNYTANELSVAQTNIDASNSTIKDVDVASESTQYAKYNILVQSGTAMLAQANSMPQSVLRLLS